MKVEEIIKTKEALDHEVCKKGKDLEDCFKATFYEIDIAKLESRTKDFIEARNRRDKFLKRDFT